MKEIYIVTAIDQHVEPQLEAFSDVGRALERAHEMALDRFPGKVASDGLGGYRIRYYDAGYPDEESVTVEALALQ